MWTFPVVTMQKQLQYFLVLQCRILHYYHDTREIFDTGKITPAVFKKCKLKKFNFKRQIV